MLTGSRRKGDVRVVEGADPYRVEIGGRDTRRKVGGREALRVVGGADPYRGREEKSIRRREVGGREGVRVVGAPTPTGWKARGGIADGRLVGKRAHSSSTATRSPFSSRRRQRKAGVGALTEGWRER